MKIITVNREFGSGGREFAKRLSELLDINYYDDEIISEIAKDSQLDEEYVADVLDRGVFNNFPLSFGGTFVAGLEFNDTPNLLVKQNEILKKIAQRGPCVIVGRAADSVLEEYEPFRIFLYADIESKVKRCRERAPEDENLTDKEMVKKIRDIDRRRSERYELITNNDWKDFTSYDLCINTSKGNIKKLSQSIAYFLKDFFE